MAEKAAAGAATEPGVDVRLLQAPAVGPDDVLAADGYIFAAPENLAALSGLMINGRCYGHDLRWQRRHERGPAGDAYRDRPASAGRVLSSARMPKRLRPSSRSSPRAISKSVIIR
jgi:hypothetical protein